MDEVHALAGSKRGAHLALSLERLDALRAGVGSPAPSRSGRPRPAPPALASTGPAAARPVQRIGLSATVRPPEEVAAYLGGVRPVTIAAPPSSKQIELKIVVPVEDMTDLEPARSPAPSAGWQPRRRPAGRPPDQRRSIWPHVEEQVLDLIQAHKSTIVFANSRRLAERLCGRLNELAAERAEALAEAARGSAGSAVPAAGRS